MKTRYFFLSIVLTLLLLTPSCISEDYKTDHKSNFEALWKIIDEKYCFFEFKEIDWNEIHERYAPQVKESMSEEEFFDLMAKMLAELKDGHTNLISKFDVSRYASWYEEYPDNFDPLLQKHYLGKTTEYRLAGGLKYRTLVDGQVGYIAYNSFTSGFSESNLDKVLLSFRDCKGIIIDVRNNGGGSLSYANRLSARFTDKKIRYGYIQHKLGKEHNNFSKPFELFIEPQKRITWLRPAIVLTNRKSYSATNDFILRMKEMPFVTIMGDRTGGGSGLPMSSELPNGWSVRFSSSPILDSSMHHIEFGIDPDIKVNLNSADRAKDIDTIIERGIQLILNY